MSMNRKNILTIAAALVVLLGGFYYFFFFADSDETVLTSDAPASAAEVSFIALVSQLDPIEFDIDVLSEPAFTRLVDIHTQPAEEQKGRTDPFGPFGR